MICLEGIYPKKHRIYLDNFNIYNNKSVNKINLSSNYLNLMIKKDILILKKHFNYIYHE